MKYNIMRLLKQLIKMKKYLFLIYIFFLFPTLASEDKSELLEITKNLRCLICQGQSIADSNSDFASTIKLVVLDELKKGKNKNEIYTFLISKYGEWIVYKPSLNTKNLFLWSLPYLIFLLGGVIIFGLFRKKKKY